MATLHHNFSGASGAITKELLAPGDGVKVKSISIANIQGTNACDVDLWIQKQLTGKFYFFKGLTIPKDVSLVYNISFDNNVGEFGLYIKLTPSTSTVLVDVIIS
tara:strand:+ start:453 stop:764 length:312 start_codon:yes stop_codon:yes gene_type:complete